MKKQFWAAVGGLVVGVAFSFASAANAAAEDEAPPNQPKAMARCVMCGIRTCHAPYGDAAQCIIDADNCQEWGWCNPG